MPAFRRAAACRALVALLAAAGWPTPRAAAQEWTPPRFRAGELPAPPQQTIGWGDVLLELTVGLDGRVEAVKPLRTTAAFDAPTEHAVRTWRFDPARAGKAREPVAASVLVAAVFRPPTLSDAPMPGELPRDLGTPSEAVPAVLARVAPVYPATGFGDGVVLVEVDIGPDGAVREATVVRSAGTAFDDAARRAASEWRFRPARVAGQPRRVFAYLVFAFRAPVVLKRGSL
jgi:TonB family protein